MLESEELWISRHSPYGSGEEPGVKRGYVTCPGRTASYQQSQEDNLGFQASHPELTGFLNLRSSSPLLLFSLLVFSMVNLKSLFPVDSQV